MTLQLVTLPGAGRKILVDVIPTLVSGEDAEVQYIKLGLGAAGSLTLIAPGQQSSAASVPAALSIEDRTLLTTLSEDMTEVKARAIFISTQTGEMNARDALADANAVASVAQVAVADSNGLANSRVAAQANTNATILKAAAGRIYDIDVFNISAAIKYLKLYNLATTPTEANTPMMTIPIGVGGGFSRHYPMGKYFSTGIAYRITGGVADNDTTVLVANDVHGAIQWI